MTFTRPRIVDPDFYDRRRHRRRCRRSELASKKFDIKVDTLGPDDGRRLPERLPAAHVAAAVGLGPHRRPAPEAGIAWTRAKPPLVAELAKTRRRSRWPLALTRLAVHRGPVRGRRPRLHEHPAAADLDRLGPPAGPCSARSGRRRGPSAVPVPRSAPTPSAAPTSATSTSATSTSARWASSRSSRRASPTRTSTSATTWCVEAYSLHRSRSWRRPSRPLLGRQVAVAEAHGASTGRRRGKLGRPARHAACGAERRPL